jgi:hypothetical protein
LEKFGERDERKYNGILSDDVIIDGKTLKGKYSLYTNPKIESWESFSTRLLITGESREWKEENVALRATVKPETVNKSVETLPWELVV